MQVECFFELLEEAERLLQSEKFIEAKSILEILLEEESQKDNLELQCYIRILYAETLMTEVNFDRRVCELVLQEAEQLCLQAGSESQNEFSICLNMDYSKFYLDQEEYKSAQKYVFQALEKILNSDNDKYYFGAVHNFVLMCQAQSLWELNSEEVEKYSVLINRVLTAKKCDFEKEVLVTFFLKMAELSFISGNVEHGNIVFRRAFELARESDILCGQLNAYIVRFGYIIHRYLKKELLTEIIKYVSRNVLGYTDQIIQIEDEATIYKVCADVSGILRIFISYVFMGVIDCSEEEYFEYVSNLKNLYSWVLSIRNNRDVDFKKWFCYSELIEKIPDNTLLVDYTQFPAKLNKERLLGDLSLSCFSVEKVNGQVFLSFHKPIYLMNERYLHLFLNATTRSNRDAIAGVINKNQILNIELYNLLIKDVLDNINEGVSLMLICPDLEIAHIPFSILLDEQRNPLIDRFRIAYVESVRCFHGEYDCSKLRKDNALILGDPRYTVNATNREVSDKNLLQPLPFSKVESEIVAELLETAPVIREYAKKDILEFSQSQIVHIATHGEVQDIEEEEEGVVFPLSRCCMYFAGANDYIVEAIPSYDFGDGILTAEEMLACKLPDVKLCVLSICFSGNGQVDYSQGMLGFRTVVLSKGARVLVSSLWEVDDFASAVFFSRFYSSVFEMPPSEAFRNSQTYLKDVTIMELKEAGWFDKKRIKRLGLVANHMEELSKLPDETKLFCKERYWAGFVLTLQ